MSSHPILAVLAPSQDHWQVTDHNPIIFFAPKKGKNSVVISDGYKLLTAFDRAQK